MMIATRLRLPLLFTRRHWPLAVGVGSLHVDAPDSRGAGSYVGGRLRRRSLSPSPRSRAALGGVG